MSRPVTLFTGQWADMELEELARKASGWGYDGLELACWGEHFDPDRALEEASYCRDRKQLLKRHDLDVWKINNSLAGQLVAGPNDERTDAFAPESCSGDPEAKRRWALDFVTKSAGAAQKLGVDVVAGLTGSPIWGWVYPFPPVPREEIEAGFERFAELFVPVLDVFEEHGVRFAHEVHPTSIAFDLYSFERSLEAVDQHPAFCLNFDPSHLYWQGVDPVCLIRDYPDRIVGTHFKDVSVSADPRTGLLASHLPFGHPDRGWDFRSPGRGDIDFEAIVRALNDVGYEGPFSVEWEDSGMDREHGAEEAASFLKSLDFDRPDVGFEEQLEH